MPRPMALPFSVGEFIFERPPGTRLKRQDADDFLKRATEGIRTFLNGETGTAELTSIVKFPTWTYVHCPNTQPGWWHKGISNWCDLACTKPWAFDAMYHLFQFLSENDMEIPPRLRKFSKDSRQRIIKRPSWVGRPPKTDRNLRIWFLINDPQMQLWGFTKTALVKAVANALELNPSRIWEIDRRMWKS